MNQGCSIAPPPFSRQKIIEAAESVVKEFVFSLEPKFEILRLTFDVVYENFIYPKYGIELVEDVDLGFHSDGAKILGFFDIEDNVAYVDASLQLQHQDPRRTFTCWHEVGGHGVLQREWLCKELARVDGGRGVITTEATINMATTNRLERQANLFVAYAAAPTWLLNYAIEETFAPTRPMCFIGPRYYTLNVKGTSRKYDIGDFDEFCRVIAYHIRWRFGGLSVEALSYRVARSEHVVDKTTRRLGLYRSARQSPAQLKSSTLAGVATSSTGSLDAALGGVR